MSEKFIKKLEKWVKDNPTEAETPTINITTGKEFTIKGVLDKLKKEENHEVSMLDEEELKIKDQMEKWLGVK